MPRVIKNAFICQIDQQDVVRPIFGDLVFDESGITRVMPHAPERPSAVNPQDETEIDAGGRILTIPGINFHEHIYARLAKGLPVSGPVTNFIEILENLWWKLDRALDLPMIAASARMTAIESLLNGVTYLFDHHVSPMAVPGSLQTIAEVLQDFNLRSVLAFEVSDRNGRQIAQQSIDENFTFITRHSTNEVKGMMGLHALFTLSDETLQNVAEKMRDLDTGIHLHLAEDLADVQLNRQKYGQALGERLRHFGLLNERSLLIHGVHLQADDYRIIADSGAALVYNPDSNLNNGVGLPDFGHVPVQIPVLAGTDGMHANVGRSVKQLFLLYRHQGATFDAAFSRLQKQFRDQLRFVRRYFPDFTRLQKQNRADFVIWDYFPPTPLTVENFWGHYLYGVLESRPWAVFQKGIPLVLHAELCVADMAQIYTEVRKQGHRLFEAFSRM